MRITGSMYYKNIYSPNQNKLSTSLYEINRQISSGLKIKYAHDDISVFNNTMRLDNEIVTFKQITKSTNSGLKFATQTDSTLNDFQTSLDRVKTLFIQAANATQNGNSLDAIYKELQGLREHLINLSNTSVNGKYIFSGSALDTKPIDQNGNYRGNNIALKSFGGNNVKIQFNIPGSELFLGEESQRKRKITTNIRNINQSELHPNIMKDTALTGSKKVYLKESDTIRDLVGDIDTDKTNDPVSHFYIKGVKSNGVTFSKELTFNSSQKISDLLNGIAELYGKESVNVRLNEYGQIEIEDKVKGSSKIDFHMFAATDFNFDGNGVDDAGGKTLSQLQNLNVKLKSFNNSDSTQFISNTRSVNDIYNSNLFTISGEYKNINTNKKADETTLLKDTVSDLTKKISFSGTATDGTAVNTTLTITNTTSMQDFINALDTAYDKNNTLRFSIKNGKIYVQSSDTASTANLNISLQTQDAAGNALKGFVADSFLVNDKARFLKKDSTVYSNVSQILNSDNSYATYKTKLSEVADLSKGTNTTLDGESLVIEGKNINGEHIQTTINLATAGSTFTLKKDTTGDGVYDTTVGTYNIFNMDPSTRVATPADNVTYKQLTDVINMSLTDQLPTTNTPANYDTAVKNSTSYANTTLDSEGKIVFDQINSTSTKAELSIYDPNHEPGVLSFMRNQSLSITDPKTNFFKQLDKAIEAVKTGRLRPDGESDNPFDIGIQNGIQVIDNLSSHINKVHAKIGSLANSLQSASDRSTLLTINATTLRSDVLDTDIAQATMKLNQLTLNYQAMLSTISRVSKISLVNYL